MTIEQRLDALEKSNRRWRAVTLLLGVALVAAFTVAATGPKEEVPDVIRAKRFEVVNDKGDVLARVSSDYYGSGQVELYVLPNSIRSTSGTLGAILSAGTGTIRDERGRVMYASGGSLMLRQDGCRLAFLGPATNPEDTHISAGSLSLYDGYGDDHCRIKYSDLTVQIGPAFNGSELALKNKTGEFVCTMKVDDYGNGVIGAWNRKGKARTLTPGP